MIEPSKNCNFSKPGVYSTRKLSSLSTTASRLPPQIITTTVEVPSTSSVAENSAASGILSPRTPRFAEATTVYSPIDKPQNRNLFESDVPPVNRHVMPPAQPSDVGFGYLADNQPSRHTSFAEVPVTPNSPLKSAMKVPGTPGRPNPLSPTFKEEMCLEKHEGLTDKENAKDLKMKTRVRMAKLCLRSTNFSCSLIVLAMLTSTFAIFNATKNLPKRGSLPAWAPNQQIWPQITLLSIACVSLLSCLFVFYGYWRGGHHRAAKAAVYYTWFSIAFFMFSIVVWSIGIAMLNQSRKNGKGQDMWGWSCKEGKRKDVFEQDVDYALVCRLQNWSMVCGIIEIMVEIITVFIYAVVFYRFYSKKRLHKSMDLRDKARSDLYLAQLRIQSAPNTPGFAKSPMSARFPDNVKRTSSSDDSSLSDAEQGEATQYASKRQSTPNRPFALQPPPIRIQAASPVETQQACFAPQQRAQVQEHSTVAPGEQTYATVPIPVAYASPLNSPGFRPGH